MCTCANCNNVSTARTRPIGAVRDLHDPTTRRSITDRGDVEWSPMSAPAPDYPHVPEHVGRCAIEAHMAHGVGANAASILMARTTIEATAKSKGISKGNLFEKIEKMRDGGVIRPATLTLAHAIRVIGNDMAHGDVEELPTEEDATDALHLMDLILEEVYQATAIADEILARRAARGQ